ncbi:MFS general substrate transporter [Bimuria novae-zelandiae CBS 107.79]|uniref:MFS general substrate transporter n=1 Tax=Bimuria novae-zelandiae CBS 107.79 TaxID=1447943 RepID=A0A6A5VDW8_9PLEO|nr:MFS general substrate transporter [Bimuria novae-zelandiae CBS 107.79]
MELKRTTSIAETLSLPREIIFVTIVCSAQLLAQAGLGNVQTIVHVIGDDFGLSDAELPWLIAGYSLTCGTFILPSGRFGDVFGYKRMLLIGFLWMALWSMVLGCSVYSNHVLFTFARVFQGIGPAIMLPNGLALFGATYAPGRRKSMIFALFGACAPTGSIIGSAFASLFTLGWWPWTYWTMAIYLVLLTLAGIFMIPDPPKKSKFSGMPLREQISNLDLPGAAAGVTALVLFNFAWNQAPLAGWPTPYVYVCLILSFLFISLFFYIELRVSKTPLIPFDALTTDVAFVLACVACGWACFGIWYYYTWQFAQVLRHASPLLSTAWISPVVPSGCLAALATGMVIHRVGPPPVLALALTCFSIGTILIMTCPVDQIYWGQLFFCTLITPWGMDMSFPAATLMLSDAMAKEHQGIAASLVNTVVNYSISLGLGFAGTVEVYVVGGGTTPAEVLKGYRAALYMAVGLSGLGMVISGVFCVKCWRRDRLAGRKHANEEK